MKMKFEIVFAFLILKSYCDTCEIRGEKCDCKMVSMAIEMSCLEKSSNPTILNLNELVIYENVTNLIVKIENKNYDGINKSSNGEFLSKPESPVCARVWPEKFFNFFFLILLIQMFNCDNIHTLRLWKRHYLVSH
jgi:hypothetical protein